MWATCRTSAKMATSSVIPSMVEAVGVIHQPQSLWESVPPAFAWRGAHFSMGPAQPAGCGEPKSSGGIGVLSSERYRACGYLRKRQAKLANDSVAAQYSFAHSEYYLTPENVFRKIRHRG